MKKVHYETFPGRAPCAWYITEFGGSKLSEKEHEVTCGTCLRIIKKWKGLENNCKQQ